MGLASAGDANGDGYADIAVSDEANKVVYVYYGGATGPANAPGTTTTPYTGADYFGWSLANAGDVDADGYGDIIVGSWSGGDYDVVHIYRGGPGGLDPNPATSIPAPTGSYEFGGNVAGGGDVNGDGCSDVLISEVEAAYSFTYPARIFVYHGLCSSAGVSTTPNAVLTHPGAPYGKLILTMTALDADGDGFWDVAVGEPSTDQAWVFMGSPGGVNTSPAVALNNGADHGQFGYALTGGDTNGDAYEDLAISAIAAPVPSSEGRVYVFPGTPSSSQTTPSPTISRSGSVELGVSVALSASGS
jgi:hypothetical protein